MLTIRLKDSEVESSGRYIYTYGKGAKFTNLAKWSRWYEFEWYSGHPGSNKFCDQTTFYTINSDITREISLFQQQSNFKK